LPPHRLGGTHDNRHRDDSDRVSPAAATGSEVAMTEAEDAPPAPGPTDVDADETAEDVDSGLDDLPDGSGCAEIWDYLSEQRRGD
jgi:hypothetical protein